MADADLEYIGAYTLEHWGAVQTVLYLNELDAAFALLAENPKLGTLKNTLKVGLRAFRRGSHVIFYREAAEWDVEIARILHERMDFERHL